MTSRDLLVRWNPLEAEAFLQVLLQSLPDTAVILLTAEGCVGQWNLGAERLLGFQEAEIVTQSMHLFAPVSDPGADEVERMLRTAVNTGEASGERWLVRKDGSQFWALVRTVPLWGEQDRLEGFAQVIRDLTEQRRGEQRQLESERRFRGIFDNALECVMILRPDGTVVEVNQPTLEFRSLQAADVIGRPLWETLCLGSSLASQQEVHAAVLEAAQGNVVRAELEIPGCDGARHLFDFSLKPIFEEGVVRLLIAEARECTERKHLQAQLHQKQKLEAIGQLAGGIAHDFNNLLTVINGFSQMLLRMVPAEDHMREALGEILKAGERAATFTRQLLAFGRVQILTPRMLDLNAVIIDLEKMLHRIIGEDIDFATALDPALRQVRADPGQLEQVLLNLVVNARDAMPRGGQLTIATRNVKLDDGYAQTHVEVKPGRYVLLSVSDTGCGIDEEVKKHIFEPFFTTKEMSKGTGLGLSTVFGIVKQSGGTIEVYSELGQGTTFKIYLPEAADSHQGSQPFTGVQPPPMGTETILLVEDDESVRSFSRQALQSWGYHVLQARDGPEALRAARAHDAPIHLLASDVVMPLLGGQQLTEKLLCLHPEMKVLYLSGFTEDAIIRHGILKAEVNFLQKPFSSVILGNKVREVLDTP